MIAKSVACQSSTWTGSDTNASGRDAVCVPSGNAASRGITKRFTKKKKKKKKRKTFPCHVCHYTAYVNFYLLRHMDTHEGDEHRVDECSRCRTILAWTPIAGETGKDLPASLRLTKNEKCHVCQKAFLYKRYLQQHIRTHAKEGHDIRTCNDCMPLQLHLTPSSGIRYPEPAATISD